MDAIPFKSTHSLVSIFVLPNIDDIFEKIKSGMSRACDDMFGFTDDPSNRFNAEYLFTVDVAKEICSLNYSHGDPYQIYFEKSAKIFARDCLLPMKFGHPLKKSSTRFRKGTPKIPRGGRIDIAVYEDTLNNEYMGHQPICAIELKGFNPSQRSVIADLKRNLSFFRVAGNTGSSVLQATAFAALHSFKTIISEEQVSKNLEKTRGKYQSWLPQLGNIDDIQHKVTAHTVSKELVGTVHCEVNEKILNPNTKHHFVGAMVTFRVEEI